MTAQVCSVMSMWLCTCMCVGGTVQVWLHGSGELASRGAVPAPLRSVAGKEGIDRSSKLRAGRVTMRWVRSPVMAAMRLQTPALVPALLCGAEQASGRCEHWRWAYHLHLLLICTCI